MIIPGVLKVWRIRHRRLRTALQRLFAVCVLGMLIVGFINVSVIYTAQPAIYDSVAAVPPSQTAVVFGSAVYSDGTLLTVTDDRVQTAIDLYKHGKVQKIIVSGDHGRTSYDEVNPMARAVLAAGVPPEDVFMDHAGFSTYDTVARAKRVFDVGTVALVTQRFHLPRALLIARAYDLSAVGAAADRHTYRAALKMNAREMLARVKDWAKVLFKPPPTYLGPRIPVTGDGRLTRDHMKERRSPQ